MSDIMFHFKVCFSNRIKVCVFYQQNQLMELAIRYSYDNNTVDLFCGHYYRLD